MLMKALPRHSKVEARLESYFHMEDFCVWHFLFCFLLVLRLCSSSWNLLNVHLFFISLNQSFNELQSFRSLSCLILHMYYFAASLIVLLYLAVFFQEASAPSSLRRWSWRWLLEAMATSNCARKKLGKPRSSMDSQHVAIAIFSTIFNTHARQYDAAKPVFVPCPQSDISLKPFHVLQLPCGPTGLCLVLIVCMPLGRIKLISFILFFQDVCCTGSNKKSSSDQNLTNHLLEEETEHFKVPRLSSHDPLEFFCATDFGFQTPGCAGGLVVGISDPSDPSKIGPWQLKWSNWTSK